jgi:hypothetical protein
MAAGKIDYIHKENAKTFPPSCPVQDGGNKQARAQFLLERGFFRLAQTEVIARLITEAVSVLGENHHFLDV